MEILSVKGHSEKIELHFNSCVSLNEACEAVKKLPEKNSFFTEINCNITYSGTDFSYNEEMKFEKTVKKIFGKDAVLEKQHRLSSRQIRYSLDKDEDVCKVVHSSLRSGEEIVSRGDIVVYGAVNPGASIVAKGNVTVIGVLRGSVYIKNEGKVYATYMNPSQIRIGNLFSYNNMDGKVGPAVAMVENDEIIIECL